MKTLRTNLEGTVQEVRSALADLSLDSLTQQGLEPMLRGHIKRFSEITGIETSLTTTIERRLPDYITLLVYRLVQESLSNIRKHADARHAEVEIHEDGESLYITVADDGQGFDANTVKASYPGEKIGLRSMQERIANVGGELNIESSPGAGTSLSFVVPIGAG